MSNLLEKLGLVEKEIYSEPTGVDVELYEDSDDEEIETADFEETLLTVDEIFKTANYSVDNSIYKVQEFKNVLPTSMTEEMTKQSVLGVLKASNIDIEDLIADGKERIKILQKNINNLSKDTDEFVNMLEKENAQLAEQIDTNKEDINKRKIYTSNQNAVFDEEIAKIKSIIDFIQ